MSPLCVGSRQSFPGFALMRAFSLTDTPLKWGVCAGATTEPVLTVYSVVVGTSFPYSFCIEDSAHPGRIGNRQNGSASTVPPKHPLNRLCEKTTEYPNRQVGDPSRQPTATAESARIPQPAGWGSFTSAYNDCRIGPNPQPAGWGSFTSAYIDCRIGPNPPTGRLGILHFSLH